MKDNELKQKAKDAFEANPKEQVLYQENKNGQCFKGSSDAKDYARRVGSKVALITRDSILGTPKATADAETEKSIDLTIKEATPIIEEMDSLEAIEAFIEGDDRKGIQEAAEERKEALAAVK